MQRWKFLLPALVVIVALVGFSLVGHLNIATAQNNPDSTTSTIGQTDDDSEEAEAVTEDNDNVENEVEETGDVEEREDGAKEGDVTEAEGDEAAEQQQLAAEAKITAAEAETIALAEVPGTVQKTELGNENGTFVYEVSIKASDGEHEVKVDALNGNVLSSQLDHED